LPHQLEKLEAGRSGHRLQVGTGVPLEMNHLQVRIHNQRRQGAPLPDDPLDGLLQLGGGTGFHRRELADQHLSAIGALQPRRQGRGAPLRE